MIINIIPITRGLSSFSFSIVTPRTVENNGELEAITVVFAAPIKSIAKRNNSVPSPIAKKPPIERITKVFLPMLLSSLLFISLTDISIHIIMLRTRSLIRFKRIGGTLKRIILRMVILMLQEKEANIAAINPLTMCLLSLFSALKNSRKIPNIMSTALIKVHTLTGSCKKKYAKTTTKRE